MEEKVYADPIKDNEEKWLSSEGVVNLGDIESGKLNIIESPCGSGKTTFVEKELWKESWCGDLLYLIDTKNGLEAFKLRGERREYKGKVYYKHRNITAMTYATFAVLCIHRPDMWLWDNEWALIVCDEMQSALKWAKIPNEDVNLHELAIKEIHNRIDAGARVVAISATPKTIREEFKDKCVDVPIHSTLKQYKIGKKKKYQDIFRLVKELPLKKRGIIYVTHIMTMIDIYNILSAERGIDCAMIFSLHNKRYRMDEEEMRVRESILKYEKIPDDVQVLIINAASETGINIKSQVDYIVVNSTNEDTVTQVIGRVRHDIDTVYLLSRNNKDIGIVVPNKYLNKPLHKEEKEKLCDELKLINKNNNRSLKWNSIKKLLIDRGYKIREKKSGSTRVTIISK